MLTKLLCKWFKLMPKSDIIDMLKAKYFAMEMSKEKLKEEYDNKEISEWSYYKKLWMLRGRLQMLEDISDTLTKK